MDLTQTVPWHRLEPGSDFRRRLAQLSRSGGRRLFHPLDAGSYVLSIQASADHASTPALPVAPFHVLAWEVAVFTADGRLLDEARDPEMLALPEPWRKYWRGGIGRRVPTACVRVIVDRFVLGPDYYDRFVLEDPGG